MVDLRVYLFSRIAIVGLLSIGLGGAQQDVFPEVKGHNLDGKKVTVPADLAGEWRLLLVGFESDHEREAESWFEAMPELKQKYPALECYEIATTPKSYRFAQFALDREMKYEIHDVERRARIIRVYVDQRAFEHALGITSEAREAVLLIDRKGVVRWRGDGIYYELKGVDLRSALKKLTAG